MLAITFGLAVCGPSVRGASLGIHHYQAHHLQAAQSSFLPDLHEPLPASVPSLSNGALLKLWQHNQFSPILRDPGIEKQLCAAVTEARNLNPTRFDQNHAVLGRLIRDPNYFNTVLNAYLTHTARFVHYHHHLIPFLRGCALMMQTPTGSNPQGTSPEQIVPPGTISPSPIPEGGNNGGGPTPPVGPSPVPAPPSIVLMVLGMGYVAVRSRIRRRPLASA